MTFYADYVIAKPQVDVYNRKDHKAIDNFKFFLYYRTMAKIGFSCWLIRYHAGSRDSFLDLMIFLASASLFVSTIKVLNQFWIAAITKEFQ